MLNISGSEFHELRKFIQGASNYSDGGHIRHSVDNTEIYRVFRNGKAEIVLECFDDDGMFYRVDESVWEAWRKSTGPIL